MNKHLFRVIFNKSRGIRMAVQETASGGGKGCNADSGPPGRGFALKPLAAALALVLAWSGATAQITPDRAAPGHQRPTVLNSANGIPTIHIQTPSAAGVSRNRYQQFDMEGRGAILNNSRTAVQSRIGGWVQGNASLARGSARVIVNEINSSAVSRLTGTLEVAGQRADVIVANPAGLVLDGLSFINAAGVTLSTGRPLYGAGGSLDGFSIQSGLVLAEGQGMDATAADYAHILARAVSLNAGIWAQDLRVVTGANDVAADGQLRAVNAASAEKPQFALDVAQIGGMYAGRIFIVGTEAGLGVRNAGVLSATSAGLTLSVEGRLENAGAMASNAAAADLRIAAQGIGNSGTLASQQDLVLDDGGTGVANGGTLQGRRELRARTGQLDNQATGVISAQRLDIEATGLGNAGHIGQTGTQALDVSSMTLASSGADAVLGARSAPAPQPASGAAGTVAAGPAPAGAESVAAADLPAPAGAREGSVLHAVPAAALVLDPGRIAVAQHLGNSGTLLANGATDLRVAQALANSGTLQVRQLQTDGMLDNSQGTLRAQQLRGAHSTLANRGGSLQVDSDLHLEAGRIDNTGGSIVGAHALTARVAQTLDNDGGTLHAGGDIALQARELQNNAQARIVSNAGSVHLQVSGALGNRQGEITTASHDVNARIDIQAASLDGSRGQIRQDGAGLLRIAVGEALRSDQAQVVGNGSVEVAAGSISNQHGNISAQADLQLRSAADILNDHGLLQALGAVDLHAGHRLANAQGRIVSHGQLSLDAGETSNRGGEIISQDGAQLQVESLQSAQGLIQSGGALQLQSRADVDNHQGRMLAGGSAAVEAAGQFFNIEGRLESAGAVSVASAGLDNSAGMMGGASIAIDTGNGPVVQEEGRIIASTGDLHLQVGALRNHKGLLHAAKDLEIDTHGQALANTGTLRALGNARVSAAGLDNASGVIQAAQALQLDSSALRNASGEIRAATVAVDTRMGALDNDAGRLIASAGDLQLQTGALGNAQGWIQAARDLEVQTHGQPLVNAGRVLAARNVAIDTGELGNSDTIQAAQRLQLDAHKVLNTEGEISAAALAIDTWIGPLTNAGGRIIATTADLDLQTGALTNAQGLLQAGQDLNIRTHGQALRNTGTLLALGHGRVDVGEMDNAGGTVQAGSDASAGYATLTINAAGALANIEGAMLASQTLTLNSTALDNSAGTIGAARLAIETHEGAVTNDQGRIVASAGDLDMQIGTLHNALGRLQAAGDLTVDTHGRPLANTATLLASGNARVNASDVASSGTIQAAQMLQLASTALTHSGEISAASVAIDTRSGTLNNDAGRIIASAGDLQLRTGALNNSQGVLQAAADLEVHTHGQPLANTGTMLGLGNAAIDAGEVDNSGTLQAAQKVQLDSTMLANSGEISAATVTVDTRSGMLNNDAGKIVALEGDLRVHSGALHNARGWLQAAQDLKIATHGQPLANTGTLLASGDAAIDAGEVDNSGTLQAAQKVQLNGTALTNRGEISAATVAVDTRKGALNNDAGRIIATEGDLHLQSGALHNARGQLQAARDLNIDTHGQTLTNTGTLLALGHARIDAGEVDNTGGTVQAGSEASAGNSTLRIEAMGPLTNTNGVMGASQKLALNSRGLNNASGQMGAAAIAIDTREAALNNDDGKIIASQGTLTLQTAALHNGRGLLQSATDLEIATNGQPLTSTGTLLALGNAAIDAGEVDNSGTVQAAQMLQLDSTALTNSGEISAASVAIDTRKGALNNDGKIIASQGPLKLETGALYNGRGLLQSATDLEIATNGQPLTNAGTVLASGNTAIDAGEVDNSGMLQAAQMLQLSATKVVNASGEISGASVGIDTWLGSVSNADGRIIASEGDLHLQSGALHNARGQLQAAKDLKIDTHAEKLTNTGTLLALGHARIDAGEVDNTAGTVQAGAGASAGNSTLAVKAAGPFTNAAGTLMAGQALALNSTALYNPAGKIGAAAIAIDTHGGALSNHAGKIIASETTLKVRTGAVHNGQGLFQAATDLEMDTRGQTLTNSGTLLALGHARIDAGEVDNTGGTVQAGADPATGSSTLTLHAAGPLGNVQGKLLASHSLTLNSTTLDNHAGEIGAAALAIDTREGVVANADGSIIASAGDLELQSGALHNAQGRVQAAKDLRLDTHGQALVNTGTLLALENASIDAGEVDNTAGTISASHALWLNSTALSNSSGQIGGAAIDIDTHGGALRNAGCGRIIASSGGLKVKSGVLHNDQGLLRSDKVLNIDTQGAMLTNRGTLQTPGDIHIRAGDFDNSGGSVLAGSDTAKSAQLTLVADGLVTNTAGNMLASGDVNLTAAELDNRRGEIGAGAGFDARIGGAVDNSQGHLLGNAAVNFHSASLRNSEGVVSSSSGPVEIRTGAFDNVRGTVTAIGAADIASGALDNSEGKIGAASLLVDTQGQGLKNVGAELLASVGDLRLQTGPLDNQRGRIAAAQDAELTSRGIDNAAGRISAYALSIRSQDASGEWAALANPAGSILADQRLEIGSAALNNVSGTIQTAGAGSALIVESHGGDIANQQSGENAGMVSAGSLHVTAQLGSVSNANAGVMGASGDMRLEARHIANQRGAITAGGKLHLHSTATSGVGIDNSDAGSMQSTGDMQIHAGASAIMSHRGTILSDGDVQVHSQGLVDNTEGRIKAGRRLSVIDSQVAANASLASARQTVSNQGGTLFAGNQLTVRSSGLSGAGQLQSQGNIRLDLPGAYSHHGNLHADGQANIAVGGVLSNYGAIWGGANLFVDAYGLNNPGHATIKSAGITSIAVRSRLENRGLINGIDTRVDADVLENLGTGRIYGDHVSIAANRLHNRAERGNGATIASRYDMDIGAPIVENENGAEIAGGDMRFGARLDERRRATGRASAINNVDATIDAKGSIDFSADLVNNGNAGVELRHQVYQGSQASGDLFRVEGRGWEDAATFRWVEKNERIPFYNYDARFHEFGKLPEGWPGRGLIKMGDPQNFGRTLPLACAAVAVADNNHEGSITYAYRYESNDSMRFQEYGVEKPHGYDVVPPQGQAFGAQEYGGVLYWPRGSNQAGYAEKMAIYENSVAAAKRLDDLILEKIKEFNRVEGFWKDYDALSNVRTEVYVDQVASSKPGQIYAGGNIMVSGLLNNVDSTVIARGVVEGKTANTSTKGIETSKVTGTVIRHGRGSSRKWGNSYQKKETRHRSAPAPYESSSTREVDLSTGVIQQYYAGDRFPAQVVSDPNIGNHGSGSGSAVMHVVRRTDYTPPAALQPGLASSGPVQAAPFVVVDGGAAEMGFPARQTGIGLGLEAALDRGTPGYRVAGAPSMQPATSGSAFTQLFQAAATPASVLLANADAVWSPVNADTSTMATHRQAGVSVEPVQSHHAADGVWEHLPGSAMMVAASSFPASSLDGESFRVAHPDDKLLAAVPDLHDAASSAPMGVSAPPVMQAQGREMEIRTSALRQYLPRSSRYIVNVGSSIKPLIETDPEFTNRASWLSSDHMLSAMRLDPALWQKRLGDGYYEQQLVRDQVALLTGRRFLGDYSDDEAQYQALLQNGITFAQDYQLRPGLALSAQQMARLTSDLVWLVAEELTLPDGSVQTVLVPKVYAVAKPGDLAITGALISGDAVVSRSKEDFHNSGTIAGRRAVVIEARNIDNIGGRITGAAVALEAERNINVVGATVSAALSLMAKAGNDINVITTTSSSRGGNDANGYSNTAIDRVAGLLLEPAEAAQDDVPQVRGIVVDAGNDVELRGALIANAQEGAGTLIKAARDVHLSTVTMANEQRIRWDARNHLSHAESQEAGTHINTLGKTRIEAGANVNARAAQVQTTKALEIDAEEDVSIMAGEATQTFDSASFVKNKGLLGSSTSTRVGQMHETRSLASSLGGDTVDIHSRGNVKVVGSRVISDHGTDIKAARDVDIVADTEKTSRFDFQQNTKSGLFSGGGMGLTFGSRLQSAELTESITRSAGSTVGSIHGDVNITAGNRYLQEGSEVTAAQADLNVTAKSITVTEAQDTREGETHTVFKQSGLSVNLSTPVLGLLQTASSLAETASQTGDARMQALAAGAAALNVAKNKDALKSLADPDGPKAEVSISITMGSSQSRSDSQQSSGTAQASKLQARGKINLVATGDGENSNIVVQGSDILAGEEASLAADNDIELLAAQHTSSDRSTSSNSSAAMGVAVTLGQGGASIGITASAQAGKGRANSDDVVHRNSHVIAGKTTFRSGRDTTLRGAVIDSNKVVGDVGGNLKLESLQDTSTFAAKQQSMGASGTFGAGFSASANYSNSRATGNFASVAEQTAIHAGDGGFELNVKNNTDLKGAVITSSQAAADQERNSLVTGTLTHSDIENHSDYQASGISMSGGFSVAGNSGGGKDGKASSGPKLYDPGKTGVTGAGFGASSTSGSEHSTTRSGISWGRITITDEAAQQALTGQGAEQTIASIARDVLTGDDANGLTKKWDGQALMREQAARAKIIEAFGQQAGEAIGTYCEGKAHALRQQADAATGAERDALLAEADKWAEGGGWRVALHTVVGGLGGGLRGALGAVGAASAAPLLDEFQHNIMASLEKAGMGAKAAKLAAQATTSTLASGLSWISGRSSGVIAAANVDSNNRQLHPKEIRRIEQLAELKANDLCGGDHSCLKHAKIYWTDMLQRAAESSVDVELDRKNNEYYQKILEASENKGSEASLGKAQLFIDDLTQAKLLLSRDVGGIVVNSQGVPAIGTDGMPQTYFIATQEQRENSYENVFPGGNPNSQGAAIPGKEERDADRLVRLSAINGQAEVDTTLEENIFGLKIPLKRLGSAVKITEKSAGIALPGTLKAAEQALIKSGGAFDKFGIPLLDLRQLSIDQKRIMGELFGEDLVRKIVPKGKKLARMQGPGTKGIDDLYKVDRPDVDYLVIEYKFVGKNNGKGSRALEDRVDGRQTSESWTKGSNRLKDSVGLVDSKKVMSAIENNRCETWVITTRPDGSTVVEVMDALGKPKAVNTSRILDALSKFSGAM